VQEIRIERMWKTKSPSKADRWFRAVWMMAVRRRPRLEMFAVVCRAFTNPFVFGVRGITARRIAVK